MPPTSISISTDVPGITVETLWEMGKLSGKCGTAIMSAAIIDDVIGDFFLSKNGSIDKIN